MKKFEILVAIISLVALCMNIMLIPGGGILTVLCLSALSLLYLFLGFALFNDIDMKEIFKKESYLGKSILRILGGVGTGISLSATVIGLMFKFQSWKNADNNLLVGLSSLFILTVVVLIKYSKNKSYYYSNILKRSFLIGGFGLILLLTPTSMYIDYKYRNYPEYMNALKNLIADPDNKQLQNKVNEERQKMNK